MLEVDEGFCYFDTNLHKTLSDYTRTALGSVLSELPEKLKLSHQCSHILNLNEWRQLQA